MIDDARPAAAPRVDLDEAAGPKFQAQAEILRSKHAAAAGAAPPLPPLPDGVTHVFLRVRPLIDEERGRLGTRIEGSTRACTRRASRTGDLWPIPIAHNPAHSREA